MGTTMTSGNKEQEKYKQGVYKMGEFIVYRISRPWFFFDTLFALTKGFWEQRSLAKYLRNFSYNVIKERRERILNNSVNKKNDEPSSYSTRKKLAMLDMLISANLEGVAIDDEGIREEVDTFMFEVSQINTHL